jgi:hypothetical protein
MTQTQTELNVPIYYHPKQAEIFFGSHAKKKVIAKGRRFGLTKGSANYSTELLLDGVSPCLWVDTVNGNIDRYVERYFYPVLKHIPSRYWKWRQQKKELTLFDRKMDFRSADQPERIEGFAYKFIFLNEAGIILRDEYLFHNTIQPMMLDFNPDMIIGGTPKGKGLFHQLYQRGLDPLQKNWQSFHFTSFDNPYLSQDELKELVEEIPEAIQQQEIYAEFLEDSSTVFRNLRACAAASPQEPHKGVRYYAGLDIARLVDFMVLDILDENGSQVYMDRYNKASWKVQVDRAASAIKRYNNAELLIDSTGAGDPVFEMFRDKGISVKGYKFDNESKKKLIESLMLSFEHEQIQIFDETTPNGKVQMGELQIFEYEITKSGLIRYNAPPGFHDDCVIGLALANWDLKHRVEPRIWRL